MFADDLECQKLLMEAMKYHLLPELQTPREHMTVIKKFLLEKQQFKDGKGRKNCRNRSCILDIIPSCKNPVSK